MTDLYLKSLLREAAELIWRASPYVLTRDQDEYTELAKRIQAALGEGDEKSKP